MPFLWSPYNGLNKPNYTDEELQQRNQNVTNPLVPSNSGVAVDPNATTFKGYYNFDDRWAKYKDAFANPTTRAQALAAYRNELDGLPPPPGSEGGGGWIPPTNLRRNGASTTINPLIDNANRNSLTFNRNTTDTNTLFRNNTTTTNPTTTPSTDTNSLLNNNPFAKVAATDSGVLGNPASTGKRMTTTTPASSGGGTPMTQDWSNRTGLTGIRKDFGPQVPGNHLVVYGEHAWPNGVKPTGKSGGGGVPSVSLDGIGNNGGRWPTTQQPTTTAPNTTTPTGNNFNFDRSKPIEPQFQSWLNGRPVQGPNGYITQPRQQTDADPRLYDRQLTGYDESGAPQYSLVSKHPRLKDGFIKVDGQQGNFVQVPVSESGKIDDLFDENQVIYDPEFGVITDVNNIRDPDARHDMWRTAAMFVAVAAPALGAAAGQNGLWTSNNPFYSGAGAAGSTAGAGSSVAGTAAGGVGVTPPPPPVGTPVGFEQIWNGVKQVWNGSSWVRSALGLYNFANRAGLFGSRGGNVPTGNGDDNDLFGLARTGLNIYNDNKNIQDFKNQQNELFNRGDYNSQYRPGQLSRLNEFLMNPEAALQDPTYRAVRDRGLEDLSRKLNARGYNMSGYEMGELQKFGQEMDYKHIDQERSALMKSVNLGDPSGMARAGMQNLPFLFRARADRNADVNNALDSGIRFGGKTVSEWLNGLKTGQWSLDDVDPELKEMLQGAADKYGMEVDEYVSQYLSNPDNFPIPEFTINDGDMPEVDDPADWLKYFFGD